MENLNEKFKKSASFKKDELDYSIQREGARLRKGNEKNKTVKIELNSLNPVMINEIFIPNQTAKFASNRHSRFLTVKLSQNSNFKSSQEKAKSAISSKLDFSVSLKLNSKPLMQDFPLKTCATDEDHILLEEKQIIQDNQIVAIENIPESHKKPSKSSKKAKAKPINDEDLTSQTPELKEKKISSSLRKLLSDQNSSKTQIFSFTEALTQFYSLPHDLVDAQLWHVSKLEQICSCFIKKPKISQEFQELCEKIIIFTYTGFDISNNFHKNLALSVCSRLKKICCNESSLIKAGFSSEDIYSNDLNNTFASIGLLFILFLCDSVPDTLQQMIKYCVALNIAFVKVAFDVARIVLNVLRKKAFHGIMEKSQKCLEVLFFLFTGCITQWFVFFKEFDGRLEKVIRVLEEQVKKFPEDFIDLALEVMSVQVGNNND